MPRSTTYLGTRSADEAWPRVKKLLETNKLSIKLTAKGLGTVPMTLYRWLKKHPKYKAEVDAMFRKRAEKRIART